MRELHKNSQKKRRNWSAYLEERKRKRKRERWTKWEEKGEEK
jgi:hypothetical protein